MSEVMVRPEAPEKKGRRRPIRGLLIEDDPAYARLVREWIDRASDGDVRLEHSDTLSSGLERLRREIFDLVLLDLVLPDSRGYESFLAAVEGFPQIPIIVITGMTNDGQALRALRRGAQDYLVKGRVDGAQLLRSIRYAVERKKIVQREEDFFQNVNHELRNPLTTLHSAIVALQEDSGPLTDKQREILDIARRSTKHLWCMVDDLLDIARADMGKISFAPRGLSPAAALEELAAASAASAAEKRISVETDIAGTLPPAYADPVRLRQILLNLVGNALKFTPKGGTITLSARVWERNASFLLIGVHDTGPGIPASDKGKIFERMYQCGRRGALPSKGLGIGLYICHQLTARHGGKIWVESALGHGSCFYFTLPIFSLRKILRSRTARARTANDLVLISIDPPAIGGESAAERLQAARRTLPADPEFADRLLPRPSPQHEASPLFLLLPADQAGAAGIAERLRARFDLPVRRLPLPHRAAENGTARHVARLAALIEKRMRSHELSLQRAARRRRA